MAEGFDEAASSQVFNLGNKISIVKLDDEIFLLRKFQISTALEGYDLEKFLEEDPPPKYLATTTSTFTASISSSTTQIINPNYKIWKIQDRLISSWLLGSMSEEVLNQMMNCKSTKEIWNTLLEIYSARNLAQTMRFKGKLQNIRKVLCH